jgi:hypothetical protein
MNPSETKTPPKDVQDLLNRLRQATAPPLGTFGQIVEMHPRSETVTSAHSADVSSVAYVGVTTSESSRYLFHLYLAVNDNNGKTICSGVGSTTLSPGSTQDLRLSITHYNPVPGNYRVDHLLVRESLDGANVSIDERTCDYTVQ